MTSRRDHLLLVGMMGTGKTTVGKKLAKQLGRPFFDSDEQVVAATGRTVKEIFATDGEVVFRVLEREALQNACASFTPAVIAVAGGAVLDPANAQLCRESGSVVWLRARPSTLARRVGDGHGRPLLAGDVVGTLERLEAERRPVYERVANITIDVDDDNAKTVATKLTELLRQRVLVALADRSYEVLVGPGTKNLLSEMLPVGARRAAIVTQKDIGVAIECPIAHEVFFIPQGEKAKSLAVIEELCRSFARFGLTRGDVVIAVGGGVVTDVAGFASVCHHRGTPVVHVATTLLAQVDAAIGGKTGVNIPEGKNLVGAFHQPVGVICDTDVLATLPDVEWRSGCGEMAKYAFLGAGDLDAMSLVEQVTRCAALKAEVVVDDERELGRRAILNYGHTLAHALEAAGFATEDADDDAGRIRHGEAVAIGIVFAAHLARRLSRIDDARVQRHLDVVHHYGLRDSITFPVDVDELISFMGRDKKATTDGLTFVLDGPNGVELVRDVDHEVIIEALHDVIGHSTTSASIGASGSIGSTAS